MRVTIHDDERTVMEYTPPDCGEVVAMGLCPSLVDQIRCLSALESAASFLRMQSPSPKTRELEPGLGPVEPMYHADTPLDRLEKMQSAWKEFCAAIETVSRLKGIICR